MEVHMDQRGGRRREPSNVRCKVSVFFLYPTRPVIRSLLSGSQALLAAPKAPSSVSTTPPSARRSRWSPNFQPVLIQHDSGEMRSNSRHSAASPHRTSPKCRGRQAAASQGAGHWSQWPQRDSRIPSGPQLPPFCRQSRRDKPPGSGMRRDGQPGSRYEVAPGGRFHAGSGPSAASQKSGRLIRSLGHS